MCLNLFSAKSLKLAITGVFSKFIFHTQYQELSPVISDKISDILQVSSLLAGFYVNVFLLLCLKGFKFVIVYCPYVAF